MARQFSYERPEEEENAVVVTKMDPESTDRETGFNNLASSVREVAQKTGEVLNKATESIGKAIETALSARDHVVMVRVNDDALKSLDSLVQSGIFKSRSESAAFLINEGVKAQKALFDQIQARITEIERLRTELKEIITQDPV